MKFFQSCSGIRELCLLLGLLAFPTIRTYSQKAAPGFVLDSTATYFTYAVQTGTNNGRPIYEQILAPKHGISHRYTYKGKPQVDIYHRFDIGESDLWFKESEKHFHHNAKGQLTEEVRYRVENSVKYYYELSTYQYDPEGNLLQRNWFRPPMGPESIDTAVQDWGYVHIYKYSYDDAGNMLTQLDSLNRSDDDWYEYSYNVDSQLVSVIHKTRGAHQSEWNSTWEKTDYAYEKNHQISEKILSTRLGGDWVKGTKRAYLYYPNDSLHYEITYMWKSEGWQSFDTLEYVHEYNEADQVSSVESRAEKWAYTYHTNGQIDSILYEDRFKSQFRTAHYDPYGNLIGRKHLDPTDPKVPTSRVEYFYKGFPLKVNKKERGAITVFPNPASEFIHINGDLKDWKTGPVEARIYTLNGQLVCKKVLLPSSGATLSISQLSPGIYILSLHQAHQILRTKFVKQ